jgi:hypothetical protein
VIVKAGKLVCTVCDEIPCNHAKLVEQGIEKGEEWAVDITNRKDSCTTVSLLSLVLR